MVNSGVEIEDVCLNKWNEIGGVKSTLKGCLLKLSDDFKTIISIADSDLKKSDQEAWKKFVDMLPEDGCRFGYFDFDLRVKSGSTNVSDRIVNKTTMISWVGPKASIKERMIHTATVMSLKAKTGAVLVLTFGSMGDVDLEEIAAAIHHKCHMSQPVVNIEGVKLLK